MDAAPRRRAYQRYRDRQRQQKEDERRSMEDMDRQIQALQAERAEMARRIEVLQKVAHQACGQLLTGVASTQAFRRFGLVGGGGVASSLRLLPFTYADWGSQPAVNQPCSIRRPLSKLEWRFVHTQVSTLKEDLVLPSTAQHPANSASVGISYIVSSIQIRSVTQIA